MPEEKENNNEYKDMSLFKDIECHTLRARNRGVVMSNIAIAGMENKSGKISERATSDILQYFKRIPAPERKPALQVFLDRLKQEGYTVVGFGKNTKS